jgi:hypothetical protein
MRTVLVTAVIVAGAIQYGRSQPADASLRRCLVRFASCLVSRSVSPAAGRKPCAISRRHSSAAGVAAVYQ